MTETPRTIPEAAAAARLRQELRGWTLDGGRLCRTYSTDGWPTTLMLVNAIGFLAEAAWHHPDLEVGYKKVKVALVTHESNGLTERDFALAREIERLALWKPPQGSALPGKPGRWVSGGPA